MFEEFEKRKYHTLVRPPADISKYTLIEQREIDDFKCGECDGKMVLSIYYHSSPGKAKKIIKQFKCTKCELETWR